jgi:hypothetical protein
MNRISDHASPSRRDTAPPLPRLAAAVVDGATYLILPTLLLPLGFLLIRRGVMLSALAVNAIGFALVMRLRPPGLLGGRLGRAARRRVSACCDFGLSMRRHANCPWPGSLWFAT